MSFAIVDPESVRCREVIAHVNIGRSIPIQIPHHHAQSPVKWRFPQRLSFLIQKSAPRERNRFELSSAEISIKDVCLAEFIVEDRSPSSSAWLVLKGEPVREVRIGNRPATKCDDLRLAVDILNVKRAAG